MSFLRSSWRAVVGASGLGLLVPGGLLLALAVAATVSGVGGLGADLRQVFRGPDVPAASAGTSTFDDATRASADDVPEIPEAAGASTGTASTTATTDDTGTTDDGDDGAPDDGGGTPDDGATGDDGTTTTPTTRPTTPAVTTPPTPTVPPAPQPEGPVRGVGGAVAETLRPVPLVGAPVADAVQAVIDLVDPPPGVLAPPQPRQR